MKILTLLRHAKSGWDDPAQADFDRPLNARGRGDAQAIGREMRTLGLTYDRILASPAARVTETIDGLAESYGPVWPVYDERVYLASPDTLLEIVRATDDTHGRLLLIGHNPGMERLALALSGAGALRDQVVLNYPTGALAEIVFPAERWREVAEAGGTLQRFIRPRDLASN